VGIRFGDVTLISREVLRLRAFYEGIFGKKGEGDAVHSGLRIGELALSFDSAELLAQNPAFGYAAAGASNAVVISFEVEDADAEYERLLTLGVLTLNCPTTHSWGARSFQFRDPDGNILNFRSLPG
jgi:uncharacterized glyoxalase superfamily protein PhnB